MPIRPFLADQPFDPEVIAAMSATLESVCKALGLRIVDDPVTQLVAEKIIDLARHGMRDADNSDNGHVDGIRARLTKAAAALFVPRLLPAGSGTIREACR